MVLVKALIFLIVMGSIMTFIEHKDLIGRAREKYNISINWFAYLLLVFTVAIILLDKLGMLGK